MSKKKTLTVKIPAKEAETPPVYTWEPVKLAKKIEHVHAKGEPLLVGHCTHGFNMAHLV